MEDYRGKVLFLWYHIISHQLCRLFYCNSAVFFFFSFTILHSLERNHYVQPILKVGEIMVLSFKIFIEFIWNKWKFLISKDIYFLQKKKIAINLILKVDLIYWLYVQCDFYFSKAIEQLKLRNLLHHFSSSQSIFDKIVNTPENVSINEICSVTNMILLKRSTHRWVASSYNIFEMPHDL